MRKADNLPPSCAVVTKSRKMNFLESSGPVQACNGTILPFYLHHSYGRITVAIASLCITDRVLLLLQATSEPSKRITSYIQVQLFHYFPEESAQLPH